MSAQKQELPYMYFAAFPVEDNSIIRLDLSKRTEISAFFSGIKGVLFRVLHADQ